DGATAVRISRTGGIARAGRRSAAARCKAGGAAVSKRDEAPPDSTRRRRSRRRRRRMADLGVRTVWKLDLPDIRGTHLHPKDTGGALLSLDDATPADSWRWGGPEWRRHVRRERVDAITAAEMQSEDPRSLAERWADPRIASPRR